MKKAFMFLIAAAIIMIGMNSCTTVTKDVVTTVVNGGSNEGILASIAILPTYVDAIHAEQSGSVIVENHVVWKKQTSNSKAIETAKTASEKAKQTVLSNTWTLTDIDGSTYEATLTEATKDDYDCSIYVDVDSTIVATHYFKTTIK